MVIQPSLNLVINLGNPVLSGPMFSSSQGQKFVQKWPGESILISEAYMVTFLTLQSW